MTFVNLPAVLAGNKLADRLPAKAIRITAAVVLAALGGLTLATFRSERRAQTEIPPAALLVRA